MGKALKRLTAQGNPLRGCFGDPIAIGKWHHANAGPLMSQPSMTTILAEP